MKTRIITAVVAIAIFLPVLILSHTVALPVAMALCAFVAVYEMISCIGLRKAYALNIPLYLAALGLPFLMRYAKDADFVRQCLVAVMLVFTLYLFAVLTFSHGKYKLCDVSVCFFTVSYILAGFLSILFLRDWVVGGEYVYLTVFIGAWVTDTFAYFCGMLFGQGGKHKLIPDVSPKKTVEGSIGGTIFCMIAMLVFGLIVNRISGVLHANLIVLVVGGFLAAIVAQVGDLCMSLIKRTYGIKDYGKLFPGHGGMLDRFDSVIAVSIVLACCCSFFHFFEVI